MKEIYSKSFDWIDGVLFFWEIQTVSIFQSLSTSELKYIVNLVSPLSLNHVNEIAL